MLLGDVMLIVSMAVVETSLICHQSWLLVVELMDVVGGLVVVDFGWLCGDYRGAGRLNTIRRQVL